VPTGEEPALGGRAAPRPRHGAGSWTVVLVALVFLAGWTVVGRSADFDPSPFPVLNLALTGLAALQAAILLVAARRDDRTADERADRDDEADTSTRAAVERLAAELAALRVEQRTLHAALAERLGPPPLPEPVDHPATSPHAAVIPLRPRASTSAACDGRSVTPPAPPKEP
jgi:uncharacterized membrane protein